MIIHVSFCTTCGKFRMWVLTHKGASNLTEQKAVIRHIAYCQLGNCQLLKLVLFG